MRLTNTQSSHIQLLRGLAILAVVLIHNTPSGLFQVFIRPFLNFSVGLFLFLSGLLSHKETWNPKKGLLKVWIPYLIWTFIYVCGTNYDAIRDIPLIYIKSLFHGNASAVMYYIFVYCQFTLLIPLIHKLASSKYKYLGFLFAPIELILTRLIPLMIGYELPAALQILFGLSCFGYFTYFYLGFLLGNHKLEVSYKSLSLWIFLAIAIVLQILEGYWQLSLGKANCGTQLKLSVLLTNAIFLLLCFKFICAEKPFKLKLLQVLGDYSFGIYFLHEAIMMVLKKLPFYEQFVIFPANAILVLGLSWTICYLGKKVLKKYSWIFAM